MTDSLSGAFKARGAFWLKCKKPLKCDFKGLLIITVVVPIGNPVHNNSRFKDTFPKSLFNN
jgi:hypothetical protein